jgi:hypothetical protein
MDDPAVDVDGRQTVAGRDPHSGTGDAPRSAQSPLPGGPAGQLARWIARLPTRAPYPAVRSSPLQMPWRKSGPDVKFSLKVGALDKRSWENQQQPSRRANAVSATHPPERPV